MNLVRWIGLVGALVVFACGCGGGGAGASSLRDRDAGAPAANMLGGMLGTVTRDSEAGATHPGIAYSVTLTMTGFTVPAGSEVWKCQDFANPFGGQQVDIRTWDSAMTAGSHHMTLFDQPGATDGPLVDCPDGVPKATTYSFGAQAEKTSYTYPEGVGAAFGAGTMGFTMNSHYVNTSSLPIQAAVQVTIFVAAPGVVTQHAGGFEGLLFNISIPPTGQPVTVGASCTIPQDMNVIAAAGHMHKHASHFIATSGGTTLFETTEWSGSPPGMLSPPIQLKAGADLTWSCIYTNDTGAALTYGSSALTSVMCNTVLVFYPVPDVNNALLSCVH
jgi:hypothetical protein